MLISENRRVLFVHIQKNGGMTLRALMRANMPDLRRIGDVHGHANSLFTKMPRREFDQLYSFAFVRNPWDRLVSWYSMYMRLNAAGNNLRRAIFRTGSDFENFIRNGLSVKATFGRKAVRSTGFNQLDYITDAAGQVIVKDIYRFEDFENEVHRLFGKLGIEIPHIPHINATRHRHYSTYYTDELREIVAAHYARDIAHFGYTFERQQ